MPGPISVQEAVRLAKAAKTEASSQEMATWIAENLGMTVLPGIVTAVLGSFLETEHLERSRQKALELVEKAKAEQAVQKPKVRKKASKQEPDSPKEAA